LSVKNNSVFRKVSLDRLASPEQLDQLLPVTDSRGWAALAGLAIVLVAAIVWSIVGSIPQTVVGTGMLVKSGGVLEVIPVASGLITDLAVNVGDSVKEGQVVARMAQPEVSTRLQQGKAALAELRERHKQIEAFGDQNVALQRDNLARQRAAVHQSIASAQAQARWTAGKIAIQRRLVDKGLLLRQTLLENRERQQQALQQIGKGKSELAQIAVKELELRNLREQQLTESRTRIAESERTVQQLTRELLVKTQIITPYTGRILEIVIEPGMIADAGEPILRLDLAGGTVRSLEAVLFVPSNQGKQVRVGMPVLIAPATVKQEEYGLMLGRVTSVSDFPATVKGMLRVLKNEKLVSALSGDDAPYEVHADLLVDPTTTSQFRWSSSKGPPERIRSGTLTMAQIAVTHRRPIQLVLPMLRGQSGL
jgi:HlyD family secretion protein